MATDRQKRNLEYFKNKIVTIFTAPINRNFTEEQSVDYFVGKITSVDDDGIWYEHVKSKCLNFVFYDKITGIAEEKFIPANQIVDETTEESQVQIEEDGEIKPIVSPKNVQDLKNLLGA